VSLPHATSTSGGLERARGRIMGRLLAILAEGPLSFAGWLRAVRQSSPSMSEEHFDAWTAAVYGTDGEWNIRHGAASKGEDARFVSVANEPPGVALVAHVRPRSASGIAARSAAPFQRGRWVFAHEGTVEDFGYLAARTSSERRGECAGAADGELLLAFLLTRLDDRRLADHYAPDAMDEVIAEAASEVARRIGSLSFVLSNGQTLYAHRFDRSLHLLGRVPVDGLPGAVLVASEPITSEPWIQLGSRALVRCRRAKTLEVHFLSGWDPRPSPVSDVELPFTD
jgi:predicted glutamine amidotransferase